MVRASMVPGVASTTTARAHRQDKADEEAAPHLQVRLQDVC